MIDTAEVWHICDMPNVGAAIFDLFAFVLRGGDCLLCSWHSLRFVLVYQRENTARELNNEARRRK